MFYISWLFIYDLLIFPSTCLGFSIVGTSLFWYCAGHSVGPFIEETSFIFGEFPLFFLIHLFLLPANSAGQLLDLLDWAPYFLIFSSYFTSLFSILFYIRFSLITIPNIQNFISAVFTFLRAFSLKSFILKKSILVLFIWCNIYCYLSKEYFFLNFSFALQFSFFSYTFLFVLIFYVEKVL